MNSGIGKVATVDARKAAEPARSSRRVPLGHDTWQTFNATANGIVGNLAAQRVLGRSIGIQPKLATSQPDDPDEREADRVAERIGTTDAEPSHAPCPACAASGATCPKCEEDTRVQRKALPGIANAARPPIPALRSGGRPLPESARAFFEPHFRTDFSAVRIHTDASASRFAESIGARAYTVGSDIGFGRSQYAPETSDGRRLLAHELTHVIQQANAGTHRIARDKDPNAPPPPTGGSAIPFNRFDTPTKCYVPKGPTTTFEGVFLASNAEFLDEVLCDYIAKHGESKASDFVKRLHDKVADDIANMPGGGAGEDPAERTVDKYGSEELKAASRISNALDQVLAKRLTSNASWLTAFEDKANTVVLGMLQESEDRVNEERIRYGIGWETITTTSYRRDVEIKSTKTNYSMKDTPGSRALAEAATGLLKRKHVFDKADKAMRDYGDEAFSGATAFAELAMQRGYGGSGDFAKEAHLNELRVVRNQAKRDLDVFRIQKSAEFPILAAYASDEDISESSLETLQQLAQGKSDDATRMMGEEIKTRLEHIADVRKDITENGGKETKIWRIPRIINGTREMMGATPGSMYGRLVDDKVKDEAPGIWTSILLGLLQLVLVLAAPFTAGLTLIPAAAISVGQAYVHFREYERAQMLRGTDFGALALSSEDPSLFWLAVDIIGAGFDVGAAAGAALNVFRALAPAARAVRAAKTVEATELAARDLEKTAAELGGEALAKTVGRDARIGSEVTKVGETAEEAKALERAGAQMAEQELKQGAEETVREAESIAGRKVKVSEAGGVWSCASPCMTMRERYKGLLRRKGTDWEARLSKLEEEAAQIPKGKAGNEARKALADRAASLEKDMRTTAMPGEWTSPLKDSKALREGETFEDIVKRRGSVAAELDHHPPNWKGADEARFRYGEKVDAEPGYRWTLDENGALRYDRAPGFGDLPARRYNPATGMFEEAAEGGKIIKATKGVEETHELASISKKQREAMEAAFKKRGSLIAERDKLEALEEAGTISKKDSERLHKIYGQINEESRQLGENAAESVMKTKGGKKVYPSGKTYSTSGDFDQVWKKGDRFQLVEAKGGSSGLGSRAISEGVRAEQGTVEYAKSIAEHMAKHGATQEIRKLGKDLLAAIAEGKVDYILVRAPVGEKLGVAVIGDVKVSQFVLK